MNKLIAFGRKAKEKTAQAMIATSIAVVGLQSRFVFADTTAKTLMKTVLGLVAKIMWAPVALFVVMGIFNIAAGHADENGPQTKKGIGMVVAAVAIAIVAIALGSDTMISTLSDLISS